jgi:hypothetical protein
MNGNGAIVEALTVRPPPTDAGIVVTASSTTAVIQRVRILGGPYGIVLHGQSRAKVSGVRIDGAERSVVIGLGPGGRKLAYLEADHLWISNSVRTGIDATDSTMVLDDVVVRADLRTATGVLSSFSSTVAIRRLSTTGKQGMLMFEPRGTIADLRVDGAGIASGGFESADDSHELTIDRIYASRVLDSGVHLRRTRTLRMPRKILANDVEVLDAATGLFTSSESIIQRVRVRGSSALGIEVSGDNHVQLNDVDVSESAVGLRSRLKPLPVGVCEITRALIHDNRVATNIDAPFPSFTDVAFTANETVLTGATCGLGELIDDGTIRLQENVEIYGPGVSP